jgi:phage terminase large subunit-like protein
MARRMVELDGRLSGVLQIFQDQIYHPQSDSVLEPLPAEAGQLQGRNPSCVIADEVAWMDPATWDSMALAGGTRARPLMLGISTAALESDSLMGRLTEHGRAGDDPAFAFFEWTAPPGCDLQDRHAWAEANPMLGDTLDPEHLAAVVKTTRPELFRRFHLNQTVGLDDA